ncbi:hypothetical protein PR048_022836 [Dryococelus australis]|uniref:Uncharacterized protein n=1 Tax=Dryococelus australis TaxID=614101 RepID=A0ABQ9GSC5_9NEOP|nr:hypothetical protein PR048_022836 [Dryococelus australis]
MDYNEFHEGNCMQHKTHDKYIARCRRPNTRRRAVSAQPRIESEQARNEVYGAAPECKCGGKREIYRENPPNPGTTPAGTEPGSLRWESSSLTATPPRPPVDTRRRRFESDPVGRIPPQNGQSRSGWGVVGVSSDCPAGGSEVASPALITMRMGPVVGGRFLRPADRCRHCSSPSAPARGGVVTQAPPTLCTTTVALRAARQCGSIQHLQPLLPVSVNHTAAAGEPLDPTRKGSHARKHESRQRGIGQPWSAIGGMATSLSVFIAKAVTKKILEKKNVTDNVKTQPTGKNSKLLHGLIRNATGDRGWLRFFIGTDERLVDRRHFIWSHQFNAGFNQCESSIILTFHQSNNRLTVEVPYTEHDENTARQLRALRVEAMAHLERVSLSPLCAPALLGLKRGKKISRQANVSLKALPAVTGGGGGGCYNRLGLSSEWLRLNGDCYHDAVVEFLKECYLVSRMKLRDKRIIFFSRRRRDSMRSWDMRYLLTGSLVGTQQRAPLETPGSHKTFMMFVCLLSAGRVLKAPVYLALEVRCGVLEIRFRALRLGAIGDLMRLAVSPLTLPRLSASNAEKSSSLIRSGMDRSRVKTTPKGTEAYFKDATLTRHCPRMGLADRLYGHKSYPTRRISTISTTTVAGEDQALRCRYKPPAGGRDTATPFFNPSHNIIGDFLPSSKARWERRKPLSGFSLPRRGNNKELLTAISISRGSGTPPPPSFPPAPAPAKACNETPWVERASDKVATPALHYGVFESSCEIHGRAERSGLQTFLYHGPRGVNYQPNTDLQLCLCLCAASQLTDANHRSLPFPFHFYVPSWLLSFAVRWRHWQNKAILELCFMRLQEKRGGLFQKPSLLPFINTIAKYTEVLLRSGNKHRVPYWLRCLLASAFTGADWRTAVPDLFPRQWRYRVRWRSGDKPVSHSGGPGFESRSSNPDFGFPWFPEIASSKCWDCPLLKAIAESFHVPVIYRCPGVSVLGTRPFVLREYVYVDAFGRLDVHFTFPTLLHSIMWGFMGITELLLRCSFQPYLRLEATVRCDAHVVSRPYRIHTSKYHHNFQRRPYNFMPFTDGLGIAWRPRLTATVSPTYLSLLTTLSPTYLPLLACKAVVRGRTILSVMRESAVLETHWKEMPTEGWQRYCRTSSQAVIRKTRYDLIWSIAISRALIRPWKEDSAGSEGCWAMGGGGE